MRGLAMNKKFLLVPVVLVPLLWSLIRWQASHSEGFKFVQSKITNSAAVRSRIGNVENVRLAFFGRYSAHYATSYTRIHMVVNAIGTKDKVAIEVDAAENDEGKWAIQQAAMDSSPVILD
jgi:hypothetical protein